MSKHITRKFRAVSLLLLVGLFGLIGCKNPFATREPEPPEQTKPTNWKQPTKATDVLENLQNAIQDKNVANYLLCFTDKPTNGRHFGFVPDRNARIRYPGVWDSWTLAQEQTYISNMFQSIPPDSVPALLFVGEVVENPAADSTVLVQEYELHIPHSRSGTQFPRVARGRAEFHLSLNEQGYWAIFLWIDDAFEGVPCWSDVKAVFSQ
ncbi:MAG TPA: hypothetical protein ENJ23_01760 [Bacteroidetes bacterium]|nr:hypothetical protein [Bacteroidota bacterium]